MTAKTDKELDFRKEARKIMNHARVNYDTSGQIADEYEDAVIAGFKALLHQYGQERELAGRENPRVETTISFSDMDTQEGREMYIDFLKTHDKADVQIANKDGQVLYAVYKTPWAMANEHTESVFEALRLKTLQSKNNTADGGEDE